MISAKPSMGYPFVTRRQVLERLNRDPAFVRECIQILHRRFQDRDLLPPPAGWMSSQRKAGEEIHAKLSSEASSAADIAMAAKIAARYAKQLAKVFRDEQIAREPGLAVAAAVFGMRGMGDDSLLDAGDDPYEELDEEPDGARNSPMESNDRPDTSATSKSVQDPPPAAAASPADAGSSASDRGPPTRRRPGRPKGSKNKTKASGPTKLDKRRRRS